MKKSYLMFLILLAGTLHATSARPNEPMRIGVAKECITPERPVWLSGYANRTRPSEGKLQDLWVKALVIDDKKDYRLIIITTDIIGLSHQLSQDVTSILMKMYRVGRSQIFINSSHTHSGPVIWPGLSLMYNLSDSDLVALVDYSQKLKTAMIKAVGSAVAGMTEGEISVGHGTAGFAMNRRQSTTNGVIIGVNKQGLTDHDVPVLKFTSKEGKTLAILFGYACHNTTLSGYELSGDYAGFAQDEVERIYPGTIAMFMAGCGADQNPEPRRTIESVKSHGMELGIAVRKTIEGGLANTGTSLKTSFSTATLEFPRFDPDRFRNEMHDADGFRRNRASFLLEAYDRGYNLDVLDYPVQCIRFGKDFTLVALADEVVVDYSLNIKKMFPEENLFVAGYSSEVQCYIPSSRILREGGYEADNSMIYYGLPGPFKENVEELIFTSVRKNLKKINVK